jgi:hypothetical protein
VAIDLYQGLKKIVLNKKQLKKIVENQIEIRSNKTFETQKGRSIL